MFYVTGHHTHHAYLPEAAPTLDELVNKVIDQAALVGNYLDGSREYWPEAYWNAPDTVTLGDDEQPPAKRPATVDILEGIAATLWDGKAIVYGQEGTTTDREVADFCAEHYDLTPSGALNAVDNYISQMEATDGKTIDRDNINDDDADFLIGCIDSWSRNFDQMLLVAVEDALIDHPDDEQQLHAAVRAAADQAVPLQDIIVAASLTRREIETIVK